MSKVDAQRAMREARYAQKNAAGPSRREAAAATAPGSSAPTSPAPAAPTPRKKAVPATAAAGEGELCGHRSMNGRSCTRAAGHSEKNHRYG